MRKSTFTEEQIAYALRQVESGTPRPTLPPVVLMRMRDDDAQERGIRRFEPADRRQGVGVAVQTRVTRAPRTPRPRFACR
jgi:hypothetical protein